MVYQGAALVRGALGIQVGLANYSRETNLTPFCDLGFWYDQKHYEQGLLQGKATLEFDTNYSSTTNLVTTASSKLIVNIELP